MDKHLVFFSKRLSYRGICVNDAPLLVTWRNRKDILATLGNAARISEESHKKWYETVYAFDNTRFDFIIMRGGEPVGTVGIKNVSGDACEVSYMIAKPVHRRKGYAKEAICAVMLQATAQGITQFSALIRPENTASIRLVESLDFKRQTSEGDLLCYEYISKGG